MVEIFKWYEEDFKPAGGAVKFLNNYRTEPIPADYEAGFYEYDWGLNVPGAPRSTRRTRLRIW